MDELTKFGKRVAREVKGRSLAEMPKIVSEEVTAELEKLGYDTLGQYALAMFREELTHECTTYSANRE